MMFLITMNGYTTLNQYLAKLSFLNLTYLTFVEIKQKKAH